MIEKINPNLTNGVQLRTQNHQKRCVNPNFTGVSPSEVKGQINKLQSPFMRWMNKFENNIGELQDVCINAVGTGLLAPIFIKYNPLSKTDEDTRTYSAWRQPISAVLAVCTSGLVTIPFSRLVKRMSNDGTFSEPLNKSPFQDEDFIIKQLKKTNPELTEAQLKSRAADTIKSQEQAILRSVRDNDTVNYTLRDIVTGKIKTQSMSKDKFKDLLLKTIAELKENEQTQLNRFDKEKIPNRIARSEYYRTHTKEAEELLNNIKNKVNETDKLEDIIKFLKEKRKAVKSDKQLSQMVTEIIDYASVDKPEILKKVNKMLGHIDLYRNATSIEQVKQIVQERAAGKKAEYEQAIQFLDGIERDIQNGKGVKYIEEQFAKQADKLGDKFRLKGKIFAEEVVKKLKDLTKRRIDGCKRIANLIVALAVLPVACSLLNWIYPRFMAAVFPNLSNKKHGNESQELVDKATKNSEVK